MYNNYNKINNRILKIQHILFYIINFNKLKEHSYFLGNNN